MRYVIKYLLLAHFLEVLSGFWAANLRAEGPVFLHLSRLDDNPSLISMTLMPSGEKLSLEAAQNHVAPAIMVPSGVSSAMIEVTPSEPGKTSRDTLKLRVPAEGRHLLLLWSANKDETKFSLIKADSVSFPKGAVSFLNLTARKAKCFLDGQSVEVPTGMVRLHPSISLARRVINYRAQLEVKGKWEPLNSSAMVLGANRRCLIVVYESPDGHSVHSATVTDYAPDINMISGIPDSSPVKAEPPLPDPPAK